MYRNGMQWMAIRRMLRNFCFFLGGAAALLLGPAASASDRTFGGFGCASTCVEQQAGYRWAEEREITDSASCSSGSRAFLEGCRAFVEDPGRGADLDDQGHEIR
jgi:hypothetical protein